MANYDNLISSIKAAIKPNGTQAITGQVLQDAMLEMVSQLGKNYAFGGVATPSTNPGTPTTNTFYIATEAGTYTNMGGVVVKDEEVAFIEWNGAAWSKLRTDLAKRGTMLITALPVLFKLIPRAIDGDDGDYALVAAVDTNEFVYKKVSGTWKLFTDYDSILAVVGTRIFYRPNNANTTSFIELTTTRISPIAIVSNENDVQSLEGKEGDYAISKTAFQTRLWILSAGEWSKLYAKSSYAKLEVLIESLLYSYDASVNDSLSLIPPCNIIQNIRNTAETLNTLFNVWADKNLAIYGDSVVALNGGTSSKPYSNIGYKWGIRVADALGISTLYCRGVGGQRFAWGSAGGNIAWVREGTGNPGSFNVSYNYDNYEGNVTIPSGFVAIRGALSSWLRITKSFPESIKDNIDAVLLMAHNDEWSAYDSDTAASFVEGNTTDPEWAASTYYNGGDFNIQTVKGGIASAVMKMQAWMPNAVIVLLTPINSKGRTGHINTDVDGGLYKVAQAVRDIHDRMSVPCIDVYATSGINGFNRATFITDEIHPYTENASRRISGCIVGAMKSIMPNE